jgi:hypothetical protein
MLRLDAGRDLARAAQQLKDAAPKLRRKLPGRLRAAVEPARVAAQAAALRTMPRHPVVVRASTSLRADMATVKLVMNPSNLPPEKRALPLLMELGSQGSGGKYIRHPVFGRTDRIQQGLRSSRTLREHVMSIQAEQATWTWTMQKTRPYFRPAIQAHQREVDKAMNVLVAEIVRDAGFH